MKTSEIQELVKIVEESDIDELEVSRWGRKIRITKNKGASANTYPRQYVTLPEAASQKDPAAASVSQEGSQSTSGQSQGSDENGSVANEEDLMEHLEEIKSPIVGTFYRATSPEAQPFVEVGDRVEIGETLCIVEAMKIMNEIEAESSGVIRDILVENSEPVEYNQTLFLLEAS